MGAPLPPTPPGDLYVKPEGLGLKEAVFPLDLFLCSSCGNIQILDVVSPKVLYANYVYRTEISLGLSEYFKDYVDDVLAFVAPQTGGLVIDIGSNDGTLLRYFKSRGFNVLGIDPAPIAQKATASGIETLQAFFTAPLAQELRKQKRHPALVTANNVVANIDDLDDFFTGVRDLIGQEGCFVFETGYGLDLVDKRLLDVIHHEHLSYFTVGSMQRSLPRYGLELIHVQHTESKGGCIRSYIQALQGPRKIQSSVARLMAIEADKKIDSIESFGSFNDFIKTTREHLAGEISRWRSQGKTVTGYGASVGTTSLAYFLGLGDKIDYVVDDNPDRFGLFTPGHHLAVYSSDALYEKRPDRVLVFAWRFIDPILKRHSKFMLNGGKFVVFLPEWRVYNQ
ncbi:MAG: class I SAM-dependent methyltransferase [Candidatus Omnitrophica bacterium]|nr:class I SAM-dependent methyltransferase [Candidatus Omnitrophota bacterium]